MSNIDNYNKNKERYFECIERLKYKNGRISPAKIYNTVVDAIYKIAISDKPLSYVLKGLNFNRALTGKDKKWIEELIRSAFPKRYFMLMARRRHFNKDPYGPCHYKIANEQRQLDLHFYRKIEEED